MKNLRLHLVRHGMVEGNQAGQYIGCRTDCQLSLEGIRELIDLRESYEYPAVGMVYTSPMTRCLQTVDIIWPDREWMIVDALTEMDFGNFEGKTMGELQGDPDFLSWLEGGLQKGPPGGETGEAFLLRVVEGIRQIVQDMMTREITDGGIVTHGGVIMTALAALGLPRRPMAQWATSNGRGYTIFINSQLWVRDGIVEVAGIMPHGVSKALELPQDIHG